jgi:hypothetical protein
VVKMAKPMTSAIRTHRALRRPQSTARRQVLRAFREQLSSGVYRPPVDELSAELATWLLCDGIPLPGSRSLRSPLPRNRG